MKFKKLWALILAISLLAGTSVLAFANEREPYVTHDIPSSMKIGEPLGKEISAFDGTHYGYTITCHNLEPNKYVAFLTEDWRSKPRTFHEHGGSGDFYMPYTDENGTATDWFFTGSVAYTPGTVTFQPGYEYWEYDYEIEDWVSLNEWKQFGDPIVFKVEEPIIRTNAPTSIKKGESLNLTTELTNTALTNTDTTYYLDENNYMLIGDFIEGENGGRQLIDDDTHQSHMPAYQPSVEIVEGQDLVKQTNQDYSNTLKSSETLTFTGTGTVKLKVKYNQFITCTECQHVFDWDGENDELIDKGYVTYSPEKIITIQVTDDSVTDPSSDSDTNATDQGKEQGTDSVNPDVEDKNIDAKEPAGTNSSAKAEQEKTDTDKPNTGDNNNVTLLIWTLIISAEAMGVLVIYKRKMVS